MHYQGCGYRPGAQVAAHSRRRFRLVPAQAGGPNTPPFDSNLWIVHYGPSDKNERIPVSQIPISPQLHHQIAARQNLVTMGKITRKDFMLSDRVNWPRIPLPARSQSMYGPPMNPRPVPQQIAYPPHGPPAVGPPPKRRGPHGAQPPQQQPPQPQPQHHQPQMIGQAGPQPVDGYEDEEDTGRGDMFDSLSPREVSLSRYKQNHEWLEEIISSPYRVDQIAMADLNIGLRGELSSLTTGIFEAQGAEALEQSPEKPYLGRLDKGLADEFRKRVEAKETATRVEIAELRAHHEKMLKEFQQSSAIKYAEKELRFAVESTGPEFWRLEGRQEAHDDSDDEDNADAPQILNKKLEDILAEVEASLGKVPAAVGDVDRVQAGGWQEPAPEPESVIPAPPPPQAPQAPPQGYQPQPGVLPQQPPPQAGPQGPSAAGDSDVEMGGTAAGMLDQMQTGFSSASASGNNALTPQSHPPVTGSNSSTPAPTSQPAQVPPPAPSADVKMEDTGSAKDQDGDWVVVPPGGVSPGASARSGSAVPATAVPAQPAAAPSTAGPEAAGITDVSNPPVSDSKPTSAAPTPGDGLAFDTNDFSSLGDLDTAGEALAGYDNDNAGEDLGELNMDMEDSAFGDAFHSVDQSGGDPGHDLD